jgi:hypothetical protein
LLFTGIERHSQNTTLKQSYLNSLPYYSHSI